MALKQVQKKVGDTVYTINQFPATRANRLLVRLMKVMGPAIGELMGIDPKKGSTDPESVKKIGTALQQLSMNVTEDEWDTLVKDLLEMTFIGTTKPVMDDFDLHFQGKLKDMYLLIAQVVMVNYSDFFGGVVARFKSQAQAATVSESPSPNT